MVSVFFAAFAFFGAIVFLPRWFQVVEGFSPTNSGLAALPLMIGLIGSSVISGLIVSRTGRYKWLIVGPVSLMGVAVLLMTQLTKDTPVPVVWLWMFIAGLGVGPTFSVPTIVIQNAVPFRELGVATSHLPFFRQIGGTVSLAFVGTICATACQDNLGPQMVAAGVPAPVLEGFAQAGGKVDFGQLTGVGDLSQILAKALPAEAQAAIPAIVEGIHGAFSHATAQTFWLGVVGALIAAAAAVAIKEIPLRTSNDAPVPTAAIAADRPVPAPDGSAASVSRAERPPACPFAPPLVRRPRWIPPGSSFVPGGSIRGHGPSTSRLPCPSAGARDHHDRIVRGRARRRRPATRRDAARQPRGSRRSAGTHV